MKADLTRSTFEARKHFRAVRMEQGRLYTDADGNEQQDILNHRIETETVDTVGRTGFPVGGAFQLTVAGGDIAIGAGHGYVDGLLCENESDTTVTTQPDWPGNASPIMPAGATVSPLPPADSTSQTRIVVYDQAGAAQTPDNGVYLGYLEAWQRHVTALEDPSIREVALGGPTTAARAKTVWQVKLSRVSGIDANVTCASDIAAWTTLTASPDGTLAARAEKSVPPKSPCLPAPDAGFRGLANQLYRVEIHDDGSFGTPRFTWSRDNGSIVSSVTRWLNDPVADEFEVSSLGRDGVLAITSGCWVEFIDDTHELLGLSGTLVKVLRTAGNAVTVDLATQTGPLDAALFTRNPKVRRWDGIVTIAAATAAWVELEDGVEVQLTPGKYRIGDYWMIPARTATADVEWPSANGVPASVAPHGVLRAFTRLAVLRFQGGAWTSAVDCRPQFPSLGELTNLYYVGGDGQDVAPDPLHPVPTKLPSPLEVGVFNGSHPVAGATVRFTAGSGTFGNGSTTQDAATGADGQVGVDWYLDSTLPAQNQTAAAELLQSGSPVAGKYNTIHFSARLSVARQVAYNPSACHDLAGVNNVQDAIDALCARPHGSGGSCCVTVGPRGEFPTLDVAISELRNRNERDICVCLLPGEHHLTGPVTESRPGVRLLIHGAGRASRLDLRGHAFSLVDLAAAALRDFDITSSNGTNRVQLLRCADVTLSHMQLSAVSRLTAERAESVLQIDDASRVELTSSRVTAFQNRVFVHAAAVLELVPALKPFRAAFEPTDRELALDRTMVVSLAQPASTTRREASAQIQKLLVTTNPVIRAPQVRRALQGLAQEFAKPTVDGITRAIDRTRAAFVALELGFAVSIGHAKANILVADSHIDGRLALGGESSRPDPVLARGALEHLASELEQNKIRMHPQPGDGDIRLRNNRLREIRMSDDLMDQVLKVATNGGEIAGMFGSLIADANVLAGPPSELFAFNLALVHNVCEPAGELGAAIAQRAKYIGNFADDDFRLLNVSRWPAFVLGNEPLNLVSL